MTLLLLVLNLVVLFLVIIVTLMVLMVIMVVRFGPMIVKVHFVVFVKFLPNGQNRWGDWFITVFVVSVDCPMAPPDINRRRHLLHYFSTRARGRRYTSPSLPRPLVP